MKLNPNFVKHTIDKQVLLVPTADADFHGLIQGNETMGFVLNCLQKDVTEDEVVAAMLKQYNGNESMIREDVSSMLRQLREIGAIDE